MTIGPSLTSLQRTRTSLEYLFRPRGIAVACVAGDPAQPGLQVLANLLEAGYPSHVAVIHPAETKVAGIPAFADLDSVPGPVEMLVLPSQGYPERDWLAAIQQRARLRRDLKVVVTVCSGSAEAHAPSEATALEELAAGCREAGVRLVGPDSLGIIDHRARLDTTCLTGLHRRPSGISLLSQCGEMGAWTALEWSAQPVPVGLNKFISLGRMADVDLADVLDVLRNDQSTRTIGLYLEEVSRSKAVLEAAGRAAERKPVVVLTAGQTPAAGEPAPAGTVEASDLRQYGLIGADRADEFGGMLAAFDRLPLPLGGRVALLTNSGGPGQYALEALQSRGVRLGRFSRATETSLKANLPAQAVIGNPDAYVDMGNTVQPGQVAQAVAAVLRDPGIDAVFHQFIPTRFAPADQMVQQLLSLLQGLRRNSLEKPLFPVLLAGGGTVRARRLMEEAGYPTFGSPDLAAAAAWAMVSYQEHRQDSTLPVSTEARHGR